MYLNIVSILSHYYPYYQRVHPEVMLPVLLMRLLVLLTAGIWPGAQELAETCAGKSPIFVFFSHEYLHL